MFDLAAASDDLISEARGLLAGEPDPIANAANLAALIFSRVPDLNWAGFYFFRGEELVLGPFQGLPACTRIKPGKGVCGTAFSTGKTILVPDVHAFPGHIACDSASQSELVIPFAIPAGLAGVLDLDSPVLARFTEADQRLFEALARIYEAVSQ